MSSTVPKNYNTLIDLLDTKKHVDTFRRKSDTIGSFLKDNEQQHDPLNENR